MSIDVMKQALEALVANRRTHYYCEDTWYSCPRHEEGCANDAEGDECNCGADKANEQIDNAITALRAAIEQAQRVFDRNVVLQAVDDLNEVDAVLEACRIKQDLGTDRANAVLCSLLKSLDGAYLQPEQEPVAWVGPSWLNPETRTWESESFAPRPIKGWIPLYTAPRQWQGLTDEERIEFRHLGLVGVEIVEAKLKEKNA